MLDKPHIFTHTYNVCTSLTYSPILTAMLHKPNIFTHILTAMLHKLNIFTHTYGNVAQAKTVRKGLQRVSSQSRVPCDHVGGLMPPFTIAQLFARKKSFQ